MSNIISKATPRLNFTGINDVSVPVQPISAEQIAQHTPLFYIQAERSHKEPLLLSGNDLLRTLGSGTFNQRSKFYSHQVAALELCNGNGNQAFVQTLSDDDAKEATLCLALEVAPLDYKPYLRNSDGTAVRDESGVRQVDAAANDVTGLNLAWKIISVPNNDLGTLTKTTQAATIEANDGVESTIYPMFAFQATARGEYGNNLGVRLHLPHAKTTSVGDLYAMQENAALIFRAQFVERNAITQKETVQLNLSSEQFVDFAVKTGVVNSRTEIDYDRTRVLDAYRSDGLGDGTIPIFGPMDDFYVYDNYVSEVQEALFNSEVAAAPIAPAAKELLNPLSALDLNGLETYGYVMDDSTLAMDTYTTHFLSDGDDGEVSETVLGNLIQSEITAGWVEPTHPLVDIAQFPISDLYDTGFDLATKKVMLEALGLRPDLWVTTATQDLAAPEYSLSEDNSTAVALRTKARLIPESVIHGTEACRATIVGGMGQFALSNYNRRLPMVFDILDKRSKYAGAGVGILKSSLVYDTFPNNVIGVMKKVSNAWATDAQRDKDFEAGLNYPMYADRRNLVWPIVQTVYSNDASVLNSEIFGRICCDLLRQAHWTWTHTSGGHAGLTPDEFIALVKTTFDSRIANRYGSQVTVVSNPYYTEADVARGYSYQLAINVYGDPSKTVGTVTLTSYRSADL